MNVLIKVVIQLIANYHTHTWRCNHASGVEMEYVENGLRMGLQILGFSDHSPYIFPGEYYSSFRMRLEQLDEYAETILALRAHYAGRIDIPLGLELEYYPNLFPQLLPILREKPVDYLLLGQHFIGDEYDGIYNGLTTSDVRILRRYCDQTIDALQTGVFTYAAHPDLLHFCGDPKKYKEEMRRICVEARSCGIPLEVNLLGIANGRHYPNPLFWELAAEEGCDVILGRDAHSPDALLDIAAEKRGLEIVGSLGLKLIEKVSLRDIHG